MNCAKLSSLVLIAIFTSGESFAAGFAANSESASGLANSYAGRASGAHDISDSYINPAVLSDIKSKQFLISGTFIRFTVDDDNGSGKFYNNNQVSSSRSESVNEAIIPALYFATPINDKLTTGISVTSPFGLSTQYDQNWVGRYWAVDSSMSTININPMASYKVNEQLSIGGGLEAQYIKTRLTNMVDVGTALSQPAGSADGIGKAKGDDWGYGFNLGLKYKFNDKFQAGIGYRSKIKHKISGDISVDALNSRSSFDASLTTPEILSAGISYDLTNKAQLVYDTSWTRWSRVKSLKINAQNSNLNSTTDFDWQDTFRYSLGFNYKTSDKLQIRTGAAFEQGASGAKRNPRIPDSDKTLVSVGLSYKFTDNLIWDIAYMHEFLKKSQSNLTNNGSSAVPVPSLQTDYKTQIDLVGVSLRYDF